uniref:Selenoprotein Pb-like n=1 Tax=Geotrypetes seraphini TaxID=260995 RepID=A0A6P8P6V1_GEOSA|nr:selenoprotein Pb-like [Geotrypetes seraphini]
MGPLGLFILLGLVAELAAVTQNKSQICQPAPPWKINGEAPMEANTGQVTVVALLKASRHFCLLQAASLGSLRDKLIRQGLSNVSYLIVNEREELSFQMYSELLRHAPAGVPVYQQSPQEPDVWHSLRGKKDDFFIYDKCGRLAFQIHVPFRFHVYFNVEAAIRSTYSKDLCGNCTFYTTNTTLQEMENVTASEISNTEDTKMLQSLLQEGKSETLVSHQHAEDTEQPEAAPNGPQASPVPWPGRRAPERQLERAWN